MAPPEMNSLSLSLLYVLQTHVNRKYGNALLMFCAIPEAAWGFDLHPIKE